MFFADNWWLQWWKPAHSKTGHSCPVKRRAPYLVDTSSRQ